MNRQEVYKLLVMVKATWPMHFASFKTSDFESQGATWAFALSDYSYEDCSAGLKLYMRNDVKGFPPSPGQIIDCIHKLKENPLKRQTAEEAWKSVFKAICNAIYNAEEEFNKLSYECQRAVGSPENLRAMAAQDVNSVLSVEKSHFIRTYDTMVKQLADNAKIPAEFRQALPDTNAKTVPVLSAPPMTENDVDKKGVNLKSALPENGISENVQMRLDQIKKKHGLA